MPGNNKFPCCRIIALIPLVSITIANKHAKTRLWIKFVTFSIPNIRKTFRPKHTQGTIVKIIPIQHVKRCVML
ncbi:hypothetical protein MANES_06G034701v8 [Manihot esculenta]|uniref:Uncharacterized protein n=1 Tax=Manihot esculenta TaxID=3983 RepID=A0ACB7HID4_MANES|nr:hypothetical protein MANES_06G034701v8 [Manihot esculenta]